MTLPDTVEMPAMPYPPRLAHKCGWCGISLAAVPADPKPYRRRGAERIEYFHDGCVAAARVADTPIVGL